MSILWQLPGQEGNTADVLSKYEDPKPAYTTLATFLKILHNKGFVQIRKRGNKLYYTPCVSKEDYAVVQLASTKDIFFDGSITQLVQFFLKNESLTEAQANELIALIRERQQ